MGAHEDHRAVEPRIAHAGHGDQQLAVEEARVAGAHAEKNGPLQMRIQVRGGRRRSRSAGAAASPPPASQWPCRRSGRRSIPAAMSGIRTSPDPLRPHEVATDRPLRRRRRADLHRRHPHALGGARGLPEAGRSGRPGVPAGARAALGRGARRHRAGRDARGALLAAPVAARPGAAEPGTPAIWPAAPSPCARRSARTRSAAPLVPPRPPRGRHAGGPRARLPRRHAARSTSSRTAASTAPPTRPSADPSRRIFHSAAG